MLRCGSGTAQSDTFYLSETGSGSLITQLEESGSGSKLPDQKDLDPDPNYHWGSGLLEEKCSDKDDIF